MKMLEDSEVFEVSGLLFVLQLKDVDVWLAFHKIYFHEPWSLSPISLKQYWFRNVCASIANITEHLSCRQSTIKCYIQHRNSNPRAVRVSVVWCTLYVLLCIILTIHQK